MKKAFLYLDAIFYGLPIFFLCGGLKVLFHIRTAVRSTCYFWLVKYKITKKQQIFGTFEAINMR